MSYANPKPMNRHHRLPQCRGGKNSGRNIIRLRRQNIEPHYNPHHSVWIVLFLHFDMVQLLTTALISCLYSHDISKP